MRAVKSAVQAKTWRFAWANSNRQGVQEVNFIFGLRAA
jgi:hypothetical protein